MRTKTPIGERLDAVLVMPADQLNAAITKEFGTADHPGTTDAALSICAGKGWFPNVGLFDDIRSTRKIWQCTIFYKPGSQSRAVAESDYVTEMPLHALCRAMLYAALASRDL